MSLSRHLLAFAFMLAFVLQPLMATYGQLHEVLAHAGEDRAHVEGDAHDAGASARDEASSGPQSDFERESGVLHALSHHAHCCAQPQWLPPAGVPLPSPIVADMRPPSADPDASPGVRIDTPFRPPIVA